MTFRNRYVISGSNGLIQLSVPLENGRDQKIRFKDLRISYHQDWQQNHWKTITSCYSKSPFFSYYAGQLEGFYSKKWEFLFDLNLSILHWLHKVLAHPTEIKVVDGICNADEFPDADDFREIWLPKNFQNGNNGIRYAQVFEDRIGFQSNLSILDLLFNTGPMAKGILENSTNDNNLSDR